jgi:pimeloyl-ACP methyl ester carboxylesterase
MILGVCLAVFLPLIVAMPATNDLALLEAIDLSVKLVNLRDPNQKIERATACYTDIGCFSNTDGPMKHVGSLPSSPTSIGTRFYMYTQSAPNTAVELSLGSTNNFNLIAADKEIAVLIHGFGMDSSNSEMLSLKNAILQNSQKQAVIVTDWKSGAASPMYNTAAVNTQVVGRQVALLVNQIRASRGISVGNVHLLGFSLGSQVAGFAGKWSQSEYNWIFGRITGLDAASPLFESYPGSYLSSADAIYVDGIHTSAGSNILLGQLGFTNPFGSIDFYPNGGKSQPRCSTSLSLTCNHYSAVIYMDSSLTASNQCLFLSYKCNSWDEYDKGQCAGTDSGSRMGYFSVRQSGRGSHYLRTTRSAPYC